MLIGKRTNLGFSLVELIIVMAIMVALIAVLAPTYVKYVIKAKDAVITQAAEDVCQFTKSEYAQLDFTGEGIIKVASNAGDLIKITFMDGNTFAYKGNTENAEKLFTEACGLQPQKSTSTLAYYIHVEAGRITETENFDMTSDHNGHTGE